MLVTFILSFKNLENIVFMPSLANVNFGLKKYLFLVIFSLRMVLLWILAKFNMFLIGSSLKASLRSGVFLDLRGITAGSLRTSKKL